MTGVVRHRGGCPTAGVRGCSCATRACHDFFGELHGAGLSRHGGVSNLDDRHDSVVLTNDDVVDYLLRTANTGGLVASNYNLHRKLFFSCCSGRGRIPVVTGSVLGVDERGILGLCRPSRRRSERVARLILSVFSN